MKNWFKPLLAAAFLLFAPVAQAADSNVVSLTAAASVVGTDLWYCGQSAGTVDKKCSSAQIAAYVYGLMSGDATATGPGVFTLATVNGNVGSFGSTTGCTVITVNAKGLITAASVVTCTPAMSSVTGRAALSQLPQGIANSIWVNPTGSTADMQNVAVPACANDGAHALVYVNGTGLQCATITTGAISSVTGAIGITCSPTTGAVICSAPATRRDNTATTDTITSSDKGTIVTENNASSVAVAITTAGFVTTDYVTVKNLGAGVATYTPSSGLVDGLATLVCQQNQSADLYFDGTNYKSLSKTCGLGALATATPGANVATAAAVALSGAGGLTSTIASGTSALGTGAISSATCATVVTTAATNTATTDVVSWGFNGDPTAVTGYVPLVAGMLTIIAYPTSGNVNFKVCNNTSSSVTPGAITLNWRVVR